MGSRPAVCSSGDPARSRDGGTEAGAAARTGTDRCAPVRAPRRWRRLRPRLLRARRAARRVRFDPPCARAARDAAARRASRPGASPRRGCGGNPCGACRGRLDVARPAAGVAAAAVRPRCTGQRAMHRSSDGARTPVLAGESVVVPQRVATWVALGYLVVVGSVVVFVLFLFVLRHWAASRTAYVYVLVPFVTVALSAWLDDEPVGAGLVLGGLLVLTGVYVGALRPARTPSTLPEAAVGPALHAATTGPGPPGLLSHDR